MTNDPECWPVEPVPDEPRPPEPHHDHRDPGDRERLRGREPEWFKRLLEQREDIQ